MSERVTQKNLYDYLNEYEQLCIALYVYRDKTSDYMCERYKGIELRNKRNDKMKEILDKFNMGLK
jgi:hypothetical protein